MDRKETRAEVLLLLWPQLEEAIDNLTSCCIFPIEKETLALQCNPHKSNSMLNYDSTNSQPVCLDFHFLNLTSCGMFQIAVNCTLHKHSTCTSVASLYTTQPEVKKSLN